MTSPQPRRGAPPGTAPGPDGPGAAPGRAALEGAGKTGGGGGGASCRAARGLAGCGAGRAGPVAPSGAFLTAARRDPPAGLPCAVGGRESLSWREQGAGCWRSCGGCVAGGGGACCSGPAVVAQWHRRRGSLCYGVGERAAAAADGASKLEQALREGISVTRGCYHASEEPQSPFALSRDAVSMQMFTCFVVTCLLSSSLVSSAQLCVSPSRSRVVSCQPRSQAFWDTNLSAQPSVCMVLLKGTAGPFTARLF